MAKIRATSTESFAHLESVNVPPDTCIKCGGNRVYKNGFSPERKQLYKCKDCGKNFVDPSFRKPPPVYPPGLICPSCGSGKIKRKGKRNGVQDYKCQVCGKAFCQQPYAGAGTHLPVSDDVWDIRDFGLQDNLCKSTTKLVFHHIHQEWLKIAAKRFIRYSMVNKSSRTLRGYLTYFNCFSEFLNRQYPSGKPTEINRELVVGYLEWLRKKQISATSQNHRIGFLDLFFTTARREGWLSIPVDLLYPEDRAKPTKRIPRYIPDYVLEQINKQLDVLPEPVTRMILVIQECGLRVSELLLLPLNCLEKDTTGQWFIRFMRWKMNREDIIPISNELAAVIQEQQAYIQNQFGNSFNYLFCGRKRGSGKFCSSEETFIPVPKVMQYPTFARYLKRLIERGEITDEAGKLWDLESHQFRHTVGTSMVNRGVPLPVIQRYLNHDTPTMTMTYAHIYDETLKKEINKYHSKVINIAGEVIESENPALDNDTDLQWMKKQVLGEILPNGYCGLPVQLTCSKGNACLQCGDFRTTREFLDQHKEHRERTKKALEKAKANNWKRQIQVNEEVFKNLNNIINELEKD